LLDERIDGMPGRGHHDRVTRIGRLDLVVFDAADIDVPDTSALGHFYAALLGMAITHDTNVATDRTASHEYIQDGDVSTSGDGSEVGGDPSHHVPAAAIAAERVAQVRDNPEGRLELLRSSYAPLPGATPVHLRYKRAALAFMGWQLQRGLLNPLGEPRPGSPWWGTMNERLLRDTCEARLRVLGHPGPASSPSVESSVRFAVEPTPVQWYLAHNVTIVSAYLDHCELAERENRVERFFLNLVLMRLLYAHALVAAPRLALSWLAPSPDGSRIPEGR
jgi:hypothetical protein